MPNLFTAKAAIISASVCLTISLAHAQNKTPKPTAKDDRMPVNCLIYFQYDPDTSEEDQQKNHIANNKDIKDGAAALKTEYDKNPNTPTEVNEIDNETDADHHLIHTLDAAFDGYAQQKKCCVRIDFVGHGEDGMLRLPYNQESEAPISGGANLVGGMRVQTAAGAELLEKFTSKVKAAICPPPAVAPPVTATVPPTVTFYGCYTANPLAGAPIAQQTARRAGVTTKGFTQTCDFTHDDNNPHAVFNPSGTSVIFNPKGDIVKTPEPAKTAKTDTKTDPKTDTKKDDKTGTAKDSTPVTAPSPAPRATKSTHQKSGSKSVRIQQTGAPQQSQGLTPGEAQAIGTAIGIGVGIGLGSMGGMGRRDTMDDR